MKVTEGSKPTTIVLCRRHVSAFNATGSVVWQIRLEAVGMAMCLYRSLLISKISYIFKLLLMFTLNQITLNSIV